MPTGTESLQINATLTGLFEFELPNAARISVSHAVIHLLASADYANLDLHLSLDPAQQEACAECFPLMLAAPSQRFRMHDEVIERLIPVFEAGQDLKNWLAAGNGALLRLENYTYEGPSAFEEAEVDSASS